MLILVVPPLLIGIINKTKAVVAGRQGPPLLQLYYDINKLMRKGIVLSRTTTWVFLAGPAVGLVTTILAALFVPLGGHAAPVAFDGDFVLFAYVLGLGRFFTIAAALDTGSAFEGMGGAREATFSCLAEPALFLVLLALVPYLIDRSQTGVALWFNREGRRAQLIVLIVVVAMIGLTIVGAGQ